MFQIAKFRGKNFFAPQDIDLEDSMFWRKLKLKTSVGAEMGRHNSIYKSRQQPTTSDAKQDIFKFYIH